MPYIRRGPDRQIESLHRRGDEGMEFLPSGHPDILAFVGQTPSGSSQFDKLDAEFVRVIEDVIDTLIVKNIINITDLPGEAQAKLFARKTFRERVSKNSLRLFTETEFNPVIDDTNFGGLPP